MSAKPKGFRRTKDQADKLKYEVTVFAASNPNLTQQAIGKRFNITQGRVSRILRGER